MATNTIGLGRDYATISDWANYIKSLGPLTEDYIGLVANDSVYGYDSSSVLSFNGVTDNGYDIILRGSGAGKHTGDFGTGAVLSGSASFTILYRPSNITMEDLEIENTAANVFAVLEPSGGNYRRLLIRAPNTNASNGRGIRILPGAGTVNRFEACRIAGCEFGIQDQSTVSFSEFVNLTIESCGVGVDVVAGNSSSFHNVVCTSTCDSSFVGGFLDSSCSNNASFDGAQPGVNGVTLSGDPFEADGYTPSVGGLLDGAGSTTYAVIDDASGRLFNSPPSIGAYEVPNTEPTIIDVDGDEIIVDGQTNLRILLEQYTTAPNKVSLRRVSSPSLETLTSNLTSGIDSATFDLPDISQYATDTTGVPFTSLSHSILLRAENDSEQDDISVAYNPKSGYAVTEVFSSSQLEGSVFQNFSGAPSDGSQVYYPTASNTSVDSQGFLFTDATSDIDMQFWDIGDNTWKPFSVLIGLPELPTSGTISFSDLRREFDSTGSEVRFSDFYRGGSFVPRIEQNADVPITGQVATSDFYGATKIESVPFGASRTSGVAPLSVQFDAGFEGSTPYKQDFLNLYYLWDYGDSNNSTWLNGRSRNTDTGPIGAHVYDSVGTYNVSLTVIDPLTDTTVRTESTTITVTDPDTYYSGTDTICINNVGDTDFSEKPSGALEVNNDDVSSVISTHWASNKRLLFKRGGSWTHNSGTFGNNVINAQLGAYGTGTGADSQGLFSNAPSLVSTNGTTFAFINNWQNCVVSDLEIRDSSESGLGITGTTYIGNVLVQNMKISGYNQPYGLSKNRTKDSDTFDGNFIVNSNINNGGSLVVFTGGDRMAILGNQMSDARDQHVLRIFQSYKSRISHNQISGSNLNGIGGQQAIKFHAPDLEQIGKFADVVSASGFKHTTSFNCLSDNLIGGSPPWPVIVGPENNTSDEYITDTIYERNLYRSDFGNYPTSPPTDIAQTIRFNCSFGVVRNNISHVDATRSEGGGRMIAVARSGIEPTPEYVFVYNNTLVSEDTTGSGWEGVVLGDFGNDSSSLTNNCFVSNNLLHTAGVTTTSVTDFGENNNISNNLSGLTYPITNPFLTNPSNRDYTLSVGSGGINTGTVVSVYDDYTGQKRQDVFDVGAYSDSATIAFAFANATGGSPDYIANAPRPTTGACRAEFEIQNDGDIARYINLTADATGAENDIGDWISPKTSANGDAFQFRVGDRVGTDPSRGGSAVTIPTGAISSQSWTNLDSGANYYLGVDGTSDTTTFSFQLRYTPTGAESPVSDVTITADGTGA